MKRLFILLIILTSCYYIWGEAGGPTYVGYQKCRGCHRGERRDHISDKWEISKHAQAFEVLNAEERQNPVCLQCHTTGYGQTTDGEILEGVQCEACHGPGSEYKSGRIMNERRFEVQREKQHKQALEAGLIVPTMKTCRRCHRTVEAEFLKLLPDPSTERNP